MLLMISIQVLQQTLIILKQILPPSQNNSNNNKESNVACKGKIKGNANSKIYHVPEGEFYDKATSNIAWFCTEKEA
ncbi:sunset domain-containing protein [Bacillus toyonensis]|uniref:sunset domain-containing protein n=1 Tax=Bacillus toyonensis TaxID=155322 RepID=UPI003FA1BD4B